MLSGMTIKEQRYLLLMHPKIFIIKRTVFSIFLLLLLPACGQKVERNPNSFVASSIGDARRLNPVIANDSASGTINDQVFNGLVKYDKDIKSLGRFGIFAFLPSTM